MYSNETNLLLNEVKKGSVQDIQIDLAQVTSKGAREIYLRHIIASIREVKEEERKKGNKCQINLIVDLMPEEVLMFQKAKDNQGNKLFEVGGVIKKTKLRIEQHRFTSK